MKVSKYNKYRKYNSLYYILNILRRKTVCVSSEIYYALSANRIDDISENLKLKLQQSGILVSENINEFEYYRHIINKEIYKGQAVLTVLPTLDCNFRCKYCAIPNLNKNMCETKIDSARIIGILSGWKNDIKSLRINWYGGEPMLELGQVLKISRDIRQYCNKHQIIYTAKMITNGYLLNVADFLRLLDENVLFYQITLDGSPNIHDVNRPHKLGNSTYDTILSNLVKIRDVNRYFQIAIRANVGRKDVQAKLEYERLFCNDNRFIIYKYPIKDWNYGMKLDIERDDLVDDAYIFEDSMQFKSFFYGSITELLCEAQTAYSLTIGPDGIMECAHYPNIVIPNFDIDAFAIDSHISSFVQKKCSKQASCSYAPMCDLFFCPKHVTCCNETLEKIVDSLIKVSIDEGLVTYLTETHSLLSESHATI